MYSTIKKIVRNIIPKQILFKHELNFRFFYYQLYKGDKFQCTVCGKKLRNFISSNDDKICPRCGSISRSRRLWNLLNSKYLKLNISILDFSPSRDLFRLLKKGNFNYTSSDLSGNFISDVSFDITKINSENNTYDLIICYHILEHIVDDSAAMKELHRVLKKNGFCIIQTPFKEGEIYENSSIKTPEERLIHFGQDDHVRIYSASGLKERLQNSGFQVEILEFNELEKNKNGFKNNETILVCKKQ